MNPHMPAEQLNEPAVGKREAKGDRQVGLGQDARSQLRTIVESAKAGQAERGGIRDEARRTSFPVLFPASCAARGGR